MEISHGILHQQKYNNAPFSLVILDLQSLVIPLSLPSLGEACKFKKQAALNCPQATEPGDLQHSTLASHLKWEVPGVRSWRFPYVYERVCIELFAYVHVYLPNLLHNQWPPSHTMAIKLPQPATEKVNILLDWHKQHHLLLVLLQFYSLYLNHTNMERPHTISFTDEHTADKSTI